MIKNSIVALILGLPLFACAPAASPDSGAPADTFVPAPGDVPNAGPMCNSISGEFAMTGMKTNTDNCVMPAAGNPIMGTLTIANVTMAGFDLTITPTGGMPITCTGNLSADCVFMGLCNGDNLTLTIRNNMISGNIAITGEAGCKTTYAVTGTRN